MGRYGSTMTKARCNFPTITPGQCRAARQLAGLKAADLAAASGVSLGTVKAFETGKRNIASRTMRDMVSAFEREGIAFGCSRDADGNSVASVTMLSALA
jgi:transcriptional regulator with XRE-family HTH domain